MEQLNTLNRLIMKQTNPSENFEQDELIRDIEAYLGVDLETFGEVQRLMGFSPEGVNRWFEAEIDKDDPNLRVIAELERLGYEFKLPKEKDLFYAAEHDKVGLAIYLLDRGADIEESEHYCHRKPLHFAAKFDSIQVATLLLDRGADIEAKNGYKSTPLHYAASNDSIQVATLLLDRGTDINSSNKWQDTPFHWVAKDDSIRVATLLLDRGADMEI